MSTLDNIHSFYFVGIGGIGMSALARYFNAQKKYVSGYDKTPSPLTRKLEEEGIVVNYNDEIGEIPKEILENPNALIVFTPAIPKDHQQFNYLKAQNFNCKKRAEVLGLITKNRFTLAVAGTHGKTTTTAILAHLLKETGAPVTAFLGGISEDIQSNLILKGDKVVVVEADEFDRSFLQLSPNIAAITSMDADHLDIYEKSENLMTSFQDFANLVAQDGTLFIKNGLPLKGVTVGIEDDAAYSAINITVENGTYSFDLKTPTTIVKNLKFILPGKHNLLNAITALAMALQYGSHAEELASALYSFKGVRRRFTYRIKKNHLVLIDDYAHHPTEISAVHQAVREMHSGKKVLAVFQPHLFSRTRDFVDDFAESLSAFDAVMLLDIYPARELPIEGVTSSWLMSKIKNNNKKLVQKSGLSEEIKKAGFEVIVIMGAGDIGEEVQLIEKELNEV